jgi:hypothetical protein
MNPKLPDDFTTPIGIQGNQSPMDLLCRDLGLQTAAGRIFLRIALENTLLMDRKQMDYGSRNISAFGTQGVIVRMSDKFERLKNLYGKKRRRAINESVLDTFRDISNYANIALMCEHKEWPNE